LRSPFAEGGYVDFLGKKYEFMMGEAGERLAGGLGFAVLFGGWFGGLTLEFARVFAGEVR